MTFTVDCKSHPEKASFLTEMQNIFEEMYSLNYDSLIDGARCIEAQTEITIKNINLYEDAQTLKEIFEIVEKENPLVKFMVG